jgi:hypothetical protein
VATETVLSTNKISEEVSIRTDAGSGTESDDSEVARTSSISLLRL